MYSGIGGKARWQPRVAAGTMGTEADLPGVRTWELTISRDNKGYADSDTAAPSRRRRA
jgi:hypothetical protein